MNDVPPDSAQPPSALLPYEASLALTQLIAKGAVLSDQHRQLYEQLLAHSHAVDAVLAALGLGMLVDRAGGAIALISTRDPDENDQDQVHPLLRKQRLTMLDSIVVLVARQHQRERELSGDSRVFIDFETLKDKVAPFLPPSTSGTVEAKHLSGSIDRMKERCLFTAVRGTEDRFEITPVLKMVVDTEWLGAMLREYKRLSHSPGGDDHAQ